MTGQETLQAFLQQCPVIWTDPALGVTIEYSGISQLVYWRGRRNELRLSAICAKDNTSCQVRCMYLKCTEPVGEGREVQYLWQNKSEFAVKAFKAEAPVCIKYDELNRLFGRIERLYFRLNIEGKVIVDIEVKDCKTGKTLCRPCIEFSDVYTYLKRKKNKNAEI